MKLLPFLTLAWASVNIAIGMSLKDDASSTATAAPTDLEYTTGGLVWSDTTLDSNLTNSTDELEEDIPCGTCVPKVYWACSDGHYVLVSLDQDAGQKVLHAVYYVGFSVSLVACIIANVIYIVTRRGLKGSPYHIHWNLIATFTLYHMVFLIGFSVMPSCYLTNVHLRNFLNVLVAYLVLANFFWMLVEGLILFCIVVKSFFQQQKGRQFIKWCFLGWGTPAVLVIIWIVSERATMSDDCEILRLDVSKPNIIGIVCLSAPILCILLINGIVLVTVMLNISKKLRSLDHREERNRHRRTAKSTMVLLILLGSYYALPILFAWIERPCLMVYIVTIIGALLSSLQGLAVSTLYVFMNREVCDQIQKILTKRFAELNVSVMTGSTQVSGSQSMYKRNSSSSGSDGRQTRRGTGSVALEAVEMTPQTKADLNSNKGDGADGGDDRVIAQEDDTGGQNVKIKTKAGVEYAMLHTCEPDS